MDYEFLMFVTNVVLTLIDAGILILLAYEVKLFLRELGIFEKEKKISKDDEEVIVMCVTDTAGIEHDNEEAEEDAQEQSDEELEDEEEDEELDEDIDLDDGMDIANLGVAS